MVPCYSHPSKLIQVPPFEIQAPLWATREPPVSQGSWAYRNAEGALLPCSERTKPLCGHLSCSMPNGGTLATVGGKSPPDNDRNSHSYNSSMPAKQVFTQVDTIPEYWLSLHSWNAQEEPGRDQLWSAPPSMLRPFIPPLSFHSLSFHSTRCCKEVPQSSYLGEAPVPSEWSGQWTIYSWDNTRLAHERSWHTDLGWLSLMLVRSLTMGHSNPMSPSCMCGPLLWFSPVCVLTRMPFPVYSTQEWCRW